jgi:hypothetical protein
MTELSNTLINSYLWQSTLAQTPNDDSHIERAKLRMSFISFRERAGQLANEIRKDLPDLTMHDITHFDALWEIASQIVGDNYILTPTEGYVLGGAILLHDLAMSLATIPGGFTGIKASQRWKDLLYTSYQDLFDRNPTPEELLDPGEKVRNHTLFNLLRQIHAENAEKLAFVSFGSDDSQNRQFLIEETEFRQTFGRVIGKIAHSHWWSIGEIEKNFSREIGAPHWTPPSWTINPMKIACILRAADAAHIDARRAPTFIKAFSTIQNSSKPHWNFQEKLNKAYLREDSLVFTSGQAFSLNEASAWWLCLETLKMIDKELRSIDSLLADNNLKRFAAKRVAGIDLPERLATYVQTSDWLPINATVHISDLPNIISSLGGEELYGQSPTIPVRELIQNACDAIRARRFFENRGPDFGEIQVSLIQDSDSHFLRVKDNGVGMSQRVLTDFLLDFGSSFWTKPQVQEEFPGLLSSGFVATGKYGIGFFSVFMAADKVTVFTRRPDAAANATLVLEFGSGLLGRPILRTAEKSEQLLDGGTVIQLQLKRDPNKISGILYVDSEYPNRSLKEVCQQIALALDVKLSILENDSFVTVIDANDWRTMPGKDFLGRLINSSIEHGENEKLLVDFCDTANKNLRYLYDDNGEIAGRACITSGYALYQSRSGNLNGSLVVGGLNASQLSGICGVLIGSSTRAARDIAKPIISPENMTAWANEQVDLVPNLYSDEESQSSCAQNIRLLGGYTGKLPIAKHNSVWVSALDIERMHLPDTLIFIDEFTVRNELKYAEGLILEPNVFITYVSGVPVIFQDISRSIYRGRGYLTHRDNRIPDVLFGAIVESAAKSWNLDINDIAEANDFERENEIFIGNSDRGRISTRAIILRKPN